jgi:hypothetical protein
MSKRIGKGIAASAAALALAAFPAGAAATGGNGNSDEQNAPMCEAGQATALDVTGDATHFDKFHSCAVNLPPSS